MSKKIHRPWRVVADPRGVLVAIAVDLGATGCSTVVTPPANPPNAVVVCIVDQGRHAKLVLPDGDGGGVAYVYGDWSYFALGKNDPWHGLLAVAIPTQGALGRSRDPGREPVELGARSPQGSVLELRVSAEAVANLLNRLGARFDAGIETRTYNRRYDLEFVKDPATYGWSHNCNTVLAEWLEELGCDCRGPRSFGDFVIEERSGE